MSHVALPYRLGHVIFTTTKTSKAKQKTKKKKKPKKKTKQTNKKKNKTLVFLYSELLLFLSLVFQGLVLWTGL